MQIAAAWHQVDPRGIVSARPTDPGYPVPGSPGSAHGMMRDRCSAGGQAAAPMADHGVAIKTRFMNGGDMQRNFLAGSALALALAFAGTAGAGGHGNGCNNKTLKGTYGFSVTGSVADGADFVPEAYSAFASYDGLGNIVLKKTSSVGGVWDTRVSTGFYQLEQGCTGIATYPTAQFQYYVAPDGSSLSFVKITEFDGNAYVPTDDRLASTGIRISKKSLVSAVP